MWSAWPATPQLEEPEHLTFKLPPPWLSAALGISEPVAVAQAHSVLSVAEVTFLLLPSSGSLLGDTITAPSLVSRGTARPWVGATELCLATNTHYSDFFNYCCTHSWLLSNQLDLSIPLFLAVAKLTDKRCVKSATSDVLSLSLLIMKSSYIFWMEYWHLFWQCWLSVFIVIILEKGKAVWNAALGWVPRGIITCYLPLIPLQHCFLWCSLAAGFKPLLCCSAEPLLLSEMGTHLCTSLC